MSAPDQREPRPREPRPEADDWQACPQGTLTAMTRELKRARRAKTLNWAGAALTLLLTVGVGSYAANLYLTQEPDLAPISCQEVIDHMPQYVHGDLDGELEARYARHIQNCRPCRIVHDQFVEQEGGHARIPPRHAAPHLMASAH